ncbi:hypothetical protein OA93_23265 [Flavobacterium sp. KMS]|nr:hypothetical protein OA93_23265 [Flavobacterium sp. KMS]
MSLVSQSGCKSRKVFSNWQEICEVFFGKFSFPFSSFLSIFQGTFRCFAGCKCNIRFPFSQAFLNLFFLEFYF